MSRRIPRGYVFLARRILGSTLWQKRPETRVAAITSIVIANHQPAKWSPDGSYDVALERGQFVRSWEGVALEANLTPKQARTAFLRLEQSDFIAREGAKKWSRFTVRNYNDYQNRDKYGRERQLPEGAVLIARKILKSPLWKLSAQDRVVAITCLLVAKYASGRWSDGTHEVDLARGQFSGSLEDLAEWSNLAISQVKRSVEKLKSIEFMVEAEREGCRVWTIPNYDYYQDATNYGDGLGDIRRESERPKTAGETAGRAAPGQDLGMNGAASGQHRGRIGAASGQQAGSTGAAPGQDRGSIGATNKKDKKEEKGEEGKEREGPPPSPLLFDVSALRGAPPPLPPEEEIIEAYHKRFPGKMGRDKIRKHVVQYLGLGGSREEALKEIAAHRNPDPIWIILDRLLNKEKYWTIDTLPLPDMSHKTKKEAARHGRS